MSTPTTDRELLELAAKAVAVDFFVIDGIESTRNQLGFQIPWNPLADDGDALRVAVCLGLSVEIHRDMTQPLPWLRVADRDGNWTYCGPQDYHGAELTQTRRTIVHAAAKIGKAVP